MLRWLFLAYPSTVTFSNGKRKKRAVKRSNTSLKDLSKVLEDHGRHSMLSFLSSLPISVLRILDTEANKFYDRNHQLYDAALLTRCYTQHALRPFIDSEINHKRHFIKIPFINKGIEFIDLPSIFKDRSVTSSKMSNILKKKKKKKTRRRNHSVDKFVDCVGKHIFFVKNGIRINKRY